MRKDKRFEKEYKRKRKKEIKKGTNKRVSGRLKLIIKKKKYSFYSGNIQV